MFASAIRPPVAATPTMAQSLARRTNSSSTHTAHGLRGARTDVSSSSGASAVSKRLTKVLRRDPLGAARPLRLHRSAQRQQRHRQVRSGIVVSQQAADA
jgi:hypothetical protein